MRFKFSHEHNIEHNKGQIYKSTSTYYSVLGKNLKHNMLEPNYMLIYSNKR